MKKFKNFLLLLLAIQANFVFSGEIQTGNPEREKTNKDAMGESFFKKFTKFQEMIADEKYVEARAGLEGLETKSRLNGYEKAVVNQFIGWIESAEGKYVAAAERFKVAIESDALPNQAHFSLMLQTAQMLIGGGEYKRGIDVLTKYYKVTDKITDSTFALEANAYSQMKNYKKAIPILKKAIGLSEEPKEQWNYLLYSLHMELSQFQQASKVLEILISINPNKEEYWKRLSGVYFNLKKDDKALAALVVADKNGMIKDEKERLRLFRMYAFLGTPYKAGKVLEQGLKSGVIESKFKHWKTLGEVWYTASEMDKSLAAFDEASKAATDGKIDFRRAYIYFDREDWPRVKSALKSAIEKGGLEDKKVGQAWLLLGMAESESDNRSGALKALNMAAKFPSTRNSAVQWMDHIKDKIKREKAAANRQRILDQASDSEVMDAE